MKSNWHGNGEKPKMGAKIQYALSKNKVATATYGIMAKMIDGGDNKFGLSDGTPWRYVLMWKYVDEDYEYGDNVQNV
jgi:hypothetical protein